MQEPVQKPEIVRYAPINKEEWDHFCRNAKNPVFMFQRDYMDYHKDRFKDHSLMFYYKNKLIALLPANEIENQLQSHGGLTYGGFIVGNEIKQHTMNDCINELIEYCKKNGIQKVLYKTVPHILHIQPCEEDLYSLFLFAGKVVKIEPTTVISLDSPLKMTKGRRAGISRAKREGIEIKELTSEESFDEFISLENEVLSDRHNTKAVHTGSELKLLRDHFPDNIHLICGFIQDRMIAGMVLFEYENTVHTQYLATSAEGRMIGGLDAVIHYVITRFSGNKKWLDFGISTENNGLYLNEGLVSQKESFGGRTNIYLTWEIDCVRG